MLNSNLRLTNNNNNNERISCKNNINLSDYLLCNDEYGDEGNEENGVEEEEEQKDTDILDLDQTTKTISNDHMLTVVPIDKEAPSYDKLVFFKHFFLLI